MAAAVSVDAEAERQRSDSEWASRLQADIDAQTLNSPSVRMAHLLLRCAQHVEPQKTRFEARRALFTRWAQQAAQARSDDGIAVGMDALLVHAHEVAGELAAMDALYAELEAATAAAGGDLAAQLDAALGKMRLCQAHWVSLCALLLCWGYQSAALRAKRAPFVYEHFTEHVDAIFGMVDWRAVGLTVGLLGACLITNLHRLRKETQPDDAHVHSVVVFVQVLLDILRRCPTHKTGATQTAVAATLTVAVDGLVKALSALTSADGAQSDAQSSAQSDAHSDVRPDAADEAQVAGMAEAASSATTEARSDAEQELKQ